MKVSSPSALVSVPVEVDPVKEAYYPVLAPLAEPIAPFIVRVKVEKTLIARARNTEIQMGVSSSNP